LGEVYKPEDIIHRKERGIPDLGPEIPSKPATPTGLGDLVREVRELRAEVEKIKGALKAKGILV